MEFCESRLCFDFVLGVILLIAVQFVDGQQDAPAAVLACPAPITATAPLGESHAEVMWQEPTLASDDFILTFQSHTPGPIAIGQYDVYYVYSLLRNVDEKIRCSFLVVVLPADTETPVVNNCPSDFEQRFEYGSGNNVVATWTEPTARDNSGQFRVESNYAPGEKIYLDGPETIFVIYEFTDPSENRAFCVFGIKFVAVDTTPPVAECPPPWTVPIPLAFTEAVLGWELPSVREKSNHLLWSMEPDVPEVFPVGTTRISYEFSDQEGLTATCDVSLTVTQQDFTPPEVAYCPESITVGVRSGSMLATVSWDEPIVSDNSGTVFRRSSHSSGLQYPVDSPFVVEYVFSDPSGNEAYCSFIVRFIEDNEAPSVYGCPKEITWFSETDVASANVFWSEPFALDETTVELAFQSHRPGDDFSVGNTTVGYIFEDSVGNTASCRFIVLVTKIEQSPSEVGQGIRVTITAIVCIALAIISILTIIGVTVYCIKGISSQPRSSNNMVNDNGGYLSPTQRPAQPTGSSTDTITDPHYHEYIEMNRPNTNLF